MKTHAKVVIIGGGVMGVSLLYHLTKRGWSDVVLVEKNELTAGSTWHAAGLCTHFAHNATIMEMRATSVRLYKDILPQETGLSAGFHASGALRVTRSKDRMDEFRHVQGLGKFVGYDFHLLTPSELKEIYPLVEIDGLIGAIYEPQDGHVDPTLATNAMAAGARSRGAEIYRHCEVLDVDKTAAGEWLVKTALGDITAEHVVNAGGTWCREIGTMMGLDLPVVPMLHQYVVTDTVPDVQARIDAGEKELPIIRDPEESWYVRQERDTMILGPYEKKAKAWSIDGVPPEFGMELLPPDLEPIEHIMMMAMDRIPALTTAGIKTVVNGPITFTPDANPLIGPATGVDNAWLLTGSSMGVMEGGGAGSFLANWMVDGAPPMDPLAIDSRRFGPFADRQYRLDKATECFGLQFGVHYPFEEREAGRPQRLTPVYEDQKAAGAVFGCAYGWERPNYFNSDSNEADLTFRRPAWFEAVKAECLAVRDRVGLVDLSAFSKFEVKGSDATTFVESLGANRPPKKIGGIGLTHVLYPSGGVCSEFTITRLAEGHYYLVCAAMSERIDGDVLRNHAAKFTDVRISNRTEALGILGLMGPSSRAVLSKVTDDPLEFPWLSAKEITIAGIKVRALRVSYVGELGWELHAPLDKLKRVFDALVEAGQDHGLSLFGTYAMNSLRLEKGYPAIGADLTSERTPFETGVGGLVKTAGRAFTGKDAMMAKDASSDAWRSVLLALEPHEGVEPFYAHSVLQDGKPVGVVTSAGFGHRVDQHLALALLKPEAKAASFEILALGEKISARVLDQPPYDPDNHRLRHG
jgi:dimethylglycine dehydrogenase